MTNKVILVVGATGQQGGAVARHLLKEGWDVRALVRNPNKDEAIALSKQGAQLVQGDLYDSASLAAALEGAYGVFSVQNYWLSDVGYEGEINQGKLLAEAAKAADVEHFVYSSVGAAHRGMGQGHFESKWIIEKYIKELGLPHTIVRPAAFMDNLQWSRAEISNGIFRSWGVRQDKRTQLIAVEDIGAIVAIVLANRQEYLGRTLEIAGDELTEEEQANVLSTVLGRSVEVARPGTPEGGTQNEEQLAGLRFFNGEGYTADISGVRRIHPGLRTLDQYLRETGWENQPALPMPV